MKTENKIGKVSWESEINTVDYKAGKQERKEGFLGNEKNKLEPGMHISNFKLVNVKGGLVNIPDANQLVHIQFRRFAGCPVCNLHLQSFVRNHDKIKAAGIREVVVFHSSAEEVQIHAGNFPFEMIADPKKHLYRKFGVEASPLALADPRAWLSILRGVANSLADVIKKRIAMPPLIPEGGSFGLPADFLIAGDGRIIACKYGEHADDQWSVNELLSLVHSLTTAHYSEEKETIIQLQ